MYEERLKRIEPYLYMVFRVVFGLFFLVHGLMKFGIMSTMNAPLFSIYWFGGIIEIIVGIMVASGFKANIAGILGFAEMIAAYVIAHVPKGYSPFANGGEVALLYAAGFLVMIAYGSGKLSLDSVIKR